MDELLRALVSPAADLGPMVAVGGEQLTADELLADAWAVAGEVAGATAVAVHATPTSSTVIAVVGALLAGVPIVPVPPDSGPTERDHLLADSQAELMLVGGSAPTGLQIPAVRVSNCRGSAISLSPPSPDRPAFIVYTSGTTGLPKGAVLSRRAVAAGLDALADAWNWTAGDTLVHGLPLFHVHGLILGVVGPLRIGSALLHTGRPTPQAYAATVGSLYFGVPAVWSRITREPAMARTLRGARLLVSGSAALPVPTFEALRALTGQAPIERYGMTETLITVSTRADGERRPGWVGLPVAGVSTRLTDDDGRPIPADGQTPGHLQVRGPSLFDGYLHRRDATREVMDDDGWFRTGDVALQDASGFHRIVGRASTDLISSGGYRIGAGEVEDALLAHPGVREAAVIGTPHVDLGEQITAYVVADGLSGADLIDFVATRLSVHKRPRVVHLVEELPRNDMGKVVKSKLSQARHTTDVRELAVSA